MPNSEEILVEKTLGAFAAITLIGGLFWLGARVLKKTQDTSSGYGSDAEQGADAD